MTEGVLETVLNVTNLSHILDSSKVPLNRTESFV